MISKVLSIIFSILWVCFTIWLITAFVGLAIGAKIVSVIGWIVLIVVAIWLLRKAFSKASSQ